MNHQITKQLLFAAALLGSVAATAQADTIIFQDTFNPPTGTGIGISSYGGDATGPSVTAGSGSMTIQGNHSSSANGWGYVAGQWQDQAVSGNTSANLSDYTLSFTATAFGDAPNFNGGGGLVVELQGFDAGWVGLSGDLKTGGNPASGYNDWWYSSSGTTFSWNLGDSAVWGPNQGYGGTFDPTAPIMQIIFQTDAGWSGNAPMNWGVQISNLTLTMVPEPTTFVLAGLGAAALLIFRRR